MLDANGSFWCARRASRQSDQPNTLQVVQGRLRGAEARTFMQWLIGDEVEHLNPSGASSAVQPISAVQIRGSQRDWTPLHTSDAVTTRWARIAHQFPVACHH